MIPRSRTNLSVMHSPALGATLGTRLDQSPRACNYRLCPFPLRELSHDFLATFAHFPQLETLRHLDLYEQMILRTRANMPGLLLLTPRSC
jgi:hypothetical protein